MSSFLNGNVNFNYIREGLRSWTQALRDKREDKNESKRGRASSRCLDAGMRNTEANLHGDAAPTCAPGTDEASAPNEHY